MATYAERLTVLQGPTTCTWWNPAVEAQAVGARPGSGRTTSAARCGATAPVRDRVPPSRVRRGVREVAAQCRGGAGTERFGAEMRVSQRVLASCRSAWVTTENTSVAV